MRAIPDWRDLIAALAFRHGFDGHDIRLWENRGVPYGRLNLLDCDPDAFTTEGLEGLRQTFEAAADSLLRDVRRTRVLAQLDEFEAFKAKVEAAGEEMRTRQKLLRAATNAAEVVERAGALADAADRLMTLVRVLPGFAS